MRLEKFTPYLNVATNIGVLVGLVFVVVQLRQNNDNLATANQWALAQTSVAVWQPLVDNDDLARIELKVRGGQSLTDVEAIRYEAYVWIRLEQVWTAFELHNQAVLSESDWEASFASTQARASAYPFVAAVIRSGPMPPDLKALLLAKVKR